MNVKRSVLFISLLVLIFLIPFSNYASHVASAELTYKALGGNTYQFTLTINKDCESAVGMPSDYQINYSSKSCGGKGIFSVFRAGTPFEVLDVCNTNVRTTCQGLSVSQGGVAGLLRFTYVGTVTLPQACSDWTFSYEERYRSPLIKNIQTPDKQLMYVEAVLNNSAAVGNSSPQFTDKGVGYVCSGKTTTLSIGTSTDADGDTYKYTLIPPSTGADKDIPYANGYSLTNPTGAGSAISINPTNGSLDVTVAGTQNNISVAIAVLVEEYRNGVLIGSVMRDFQVVSQDCNNSQPVFDPKEKSVEVCPGTPIDFYVNVSDPDNPVKNQKIKITFQKEGLPDSCFTVINDSTGTPRVRVHWIPTSANAGVRTIRIIATDNNCPVKASNELPITITVVKPPLVTISDPADIRCDIPQTIKANVTSDKAPFTYMWSTNQSWQNNSSIDVFPSNYWVLVKDSKGCISDTAYKILKQNVHAKFKFTKVCEGSFVSFTDSSWVNRGGHHIVSWKWNFGDPSDPTEVTTKNSTHQYPQKGIYLVKLSVKDDTGCPADTTIKVKFCDLPDPDFTRRDSCQQNTMRYVDKTKTEYCGLVKYEFDYGSGFFQEANDFKAVYDTIRPYMAGQPGGGVYTHYTTPSDSGVFDIRIRVTNEYGCTAIKSHTYTIYSRPNIEILAKDFFLNCDKRDSIVPAVFKGSHPPLTASWNTTPGVIKKIYDKGPDTIRGNLSKEGLYTALVVDTLGCYMDPKIQVIYPLKANFDHTDYCTTGQDIDFFSDTVSKSSDFGPGKTFSKWGVKQWTWKFNNGSADVVTTDPDGTRVTNFYPEKPTAYHIVLEAEDNAGCKSYSDSLLYIQVPDNSFSISARTFCMSGTEVAPQRVKLDVTSNKGRTINSVAWSFGDKSGEPIVTPAEWPEKYVGFTAPKDSTVKLQKTWAGPNDTTYFYNTSHSYGEGLDTVTLITRYNRSCYRRDTASVRIWPPFRMLFDLDGVCVNNPTKITATSTGKNPIVKWDWMISIADESIFPFKYDTLSEFSRNNIGFQSSFDTTFTKNGNIYTPVVGTDDKGCKSYFVPSDPTRTIIKVPSPVICTLPPICQQSVYQFKDCTGIPEGKPINYVLWNYGDGQIDSLPPASAPTHVYAKDTVYSLIISNYNKEGDCFMSDTAQINVITQPKAEFTIQDVCLNQPSIFVNNSSSNDPNNGLLYYWTFRDTKDTTTSDLKDPSWVFNSPGEKGITLISVNAGTGCGDTATVQTEIYPIPTADFDWNKNKAVSMLPVEFEDKSTADVTKWWYTFSDDNTTSTDQYPIHTFTNVGASGKVQVIQRVANNYGCSDTIIKSVDLNIYINYPNAFSPNGKGDNNTWSLIIKGGKELKVLRIFNRWGEEVFNASSVYVNPVTGEMDVAWDGQFNGKDQPVGSYIFYATVLDLHNKETKLDGKITLIR